MSKPTTGLEVCTQYNLNTAQFAALPTCMRALYRAAYAADVLKVQEIPHGSNRGADVERYQGIAGCNPGDPWCAAFVTAMLVDSGADRHQLPKLAASVHGWLDWANVGKHDKLTPQRGNLGVLIHSPTTGHIVFITSVDPIKGTVHTIEGNTNDDGSREGYEVCRRERSISSFKAFIDLGFLS